MVIAAEGVSLTVLARRNEAGTELAPRPAPRALVDARIVAQSHEPCQVLAKTANRHTSAQFVEFLAEVVATQPAKTQYICRQPFDS